jgi:hypothetical protein
MIVILIADDADGADGIFWPRTDPDHPGSSSAFITEGNLNTPYSKERLRRRKRPRDHAGALGLTSGPARGCELTRVRWRHSSCLGRDGIKPAQPAKPGKITIGGAQRKPVFHGQRSQMSVWYKIAMYAGQREKLT